MSMVQMYQLERAQHIARNLEMGESDGWVYEVQPDENGFASVAVFDESGEFVDYWRF
jgi:hypothetical protein